MTGHPAVPAFLTRTVWCAVGALAALGAATAVGRSVFVADIATRADPFRQETMRALGRDDPNASERRAALRRFDAPFAAHPVETLLHVVPGGVFLTLALLQFSSRVRNRYIRFHRWSGRALILMALIIGPTGLYFGVFMPYAGRAEVAVVLLVGGLFLTGIIKAFVAIRSGDVARHREWMMRAYASAMGAPMSRVVGVVFDITLTPAGFRLPEELALALWVGFAISVGAAEIWIRYTRRRMHPRAVAVPVLRV